MGRKKDGLYPYKHPKSEVYYIRGSYLGEPVDESARTRDYAICVDACKKREREIYEQIILGKKPDRSFAEAAIGYMNSGGERKYLAPVLAAKVEFEGKRVVFGEMLLKDIDQAVIDTLAQKLYPDAKSSTRNRQVYTPVSAVLTWASDQKSWQFSHGRVRRPKQPKGRLDWRTPKEIEWWLARVGDLKPLITAYVGTGSRASEMLNLQWPNVSPAGHRMTLWEDDTKAETARGVDLQLRVRGVLPPRPENNKGHVWLKADRTRWSAYDAINNRLWHVTAREARAACSPIEGEEIAEQLSLARTFKVVGLEKRRAAAKRARELIFEIARREDIPRIHCHVFRHTWATWAYAVTRDMPWVMQQGGWASPSLAMRYIHVGSADLAEDALAYGWEIRPGPTTRLPALPAPSPEQRA